MKKTNISIFRVRAFFILISPLLILCVSKGAPLIAIVALLGLSVDMHTNADSIGELDKLSAQGDENSAILTWIRNKMAFLKSSRPTAVNLSNALQELDEAMEEAIKNKTDDKRAAKEVLSKVVLDYSEFMLARDVSDNKAIGKHGAEAILKKTGKEKGKQDILHSLHSRFFVSIS